jgi:hypothetical protein
MFKKSIKHLEENNMSYIEHFVFAFSHGIICVKAGLLLIIHSIIPGLVPATGSKLVTKLSESFTVHKAFQIIEKQINKDK